MNAYIETLDRFEKRLSDKEKRKLHLETLRHLIHKTASKEDEELTRLLDDLFVSLKHISNADKKNTKAYLKQYDNVKKYVKDTWGFVAKGTVVGEYMAMGTGLGMLIGAGFSGINPALIAIGLPIGLAIGLSIGSQKEKDLEQDGKLY